MKKIVAILALGIVLMSCGHSKCPAYGSYHQDTFKDAINTAMKSSENTNEFRG